MARTLIDRIYEEMSETERVWSAEQLCRSFLHMESTGPLAGGLIRSILDRDPRFAERSPGQWSAVATQEGDRPLWEQSFRLYWIESRGQAVSDWRLHTCLWTRGVSPEPQTWELCKPDSWLRGRRGEDEVRWVGYQPNLMRRVLVWADRNWACTESELEPIDLSRWCAVAWLEENSGRKPTTEDLQLPRLAQHWSLGPLEESPSGCITLLTALLERLRERYPESTREELAASYTEAMEPRPVEWDRLGLKPRFWEQLPAGPGLYRFWSERDELLYVGKSSDLPRRVRSYFQNLPAAPSRRENLIYQIRTIECESVPSELEALVRESRAIREEGPRFNVQIEVQPPHRFPPSWRWPLVYVPKSQDAAVVTIVGLSGQDRGSLIRLQRSELTEAWTRADSDRGASDVPYPGSSNVPTPDVSEPDASEPNPDPLRESAELARLFRWCRDLLSEPDPARRPAAGASPADGRGPIAATADPSPVCVRKSERNLSFGPAESWLALRYYSRRHDEVDRVEPLAIEGSETLVELLVSLLAGEEDAVARVETR